MDRELSTPPETAYHRSMPLNGEDQYALARWAKVRPLAVTLLTGPPVVKISTMITSFGFDVVSWTAWLLPAKLTPNIDPSSASVIFQLSSLFCFSSGINGCSHRDVDLSIEFGELEISGGKFFRHPRQNASGVRLVNNAVAVERVTEHTLHCVRVFSETFRHHRAEHEVDLVCNFLGDCVFARPIYHAAFTSSAAGRFQCVASAVARLCFFISSY